MSRVRSKAYLIEIYSKQPMSWKKRNQHNIQMTSINDNCFFPFSLAKKWSKNKNININNNAECVALNSLIKFVQCLCIEISCSFHKIKSQISIKIAHKCNKSDFMFCVMHSFSVHSLSLDVSLHVFEKKLPYQ